MIRHFMSAVSVRRQQEVAKLLDMAIDMLLMQPPRPQAFLMAGLLPQTLDFLRHSSIAAASASGIHQLAQAG